MADKAPDKPAEEDKAGADPDKLATPRAKKEGLLLLKGVRKFLRYNSDLITDERREKINGLREKFADMLGDERITEEALNHQARDLTRTCEVSVPNYKPSIIRENIEVVFVAFVIAMGIRAYFLQPFKIPTGSMQPTLNGINGFVADADGTNMQQDANYEAPGILKRLWAKIWHGRTYVNIVAEKDDRLRFDAMGQPDAVEVTRAKFIIRTLFRTESGDELLVKASKRGARELLNPEIERAGGLIRTGQVIARGYVETGDQVLVDKFSYHWMRPKRGQVFVFTTNGIRGIEQSGTFNPSHGSQHYIKRLAGVPGDVLSVEPPKLIINGEVAEEFGFRRVMSQEDGYQGYFFKGIHSGRMDLKPGQYFALGDNSNSSFDGRNWGHVPGENVVGRAVFVYWPFGQHFGRIR